MKTTITIEPMTPDNPLIPFLLKWNLGAEDCFVMTITTTTLDGKNTATVSTPITPLDEQALCEGINRAVDITRGSIIEYLNSKKHK